MTPLITVLLHWRVILLKYSLIIIIIIIIIIVIKKLSTMKKWLIALKIMVLSGKRLNWLYTKIKFIFLYITVKSRKLGAGKYVETAFHITNDILQAYIPVRGWEAGQQ